MLHPHSVFCFSRHLLLCVYDPLPRSELAVSLQDIQNDIEVSPIMCVVHRLVMKILSTIGEIDFEPKKALVY